MFTFVFCLPWSSKLGIIFLIPQLSCVSFLLSAFRFVCFREVAVIVCFVSRFSFSIFRFYSHACDFSVLRWPLNLKQKEGGQRCQLSVPALIREAKAFLASRLNPALAPTGRGLLGGQGSLCGLCHLLVSVSWLPHGSVINTSSRVASGVSFW